ncbi:MAG: pyruvate, phosphate dikinase [Promethearchaeati archaeon SRVP18_Atabeyarchaeia-1]
MPSKQSRSQPWVLSFEEADGKNKKLLGGKGAGLSEMTHIGLPVPPGFIITTEVCRQFYSLGKKLPPGLMDEVLAQLKKVEKKTGKKFGDAENPLLVSVRSGAAISMPGMMDTILNLGLNDETVKGLMKQTGDERFAYDAYRRFAQMYSSIAMGVDKKFFDDVFEAKKKEMGVKLDTDLNANALKDLVSKYKELYRKQTKKNFPDNPLEQLENAIAAVFGSWETPRAITYRKEYKITPEMADGTAVNIVTMVFGNIGDSSGTGVAFTRDPGTGENIFYGEFLQTAQGEDVVAGVRTPRPIAQLEKVMPDIYKQLDNVRETLESHYREVQDIEFTVERGKLYMLQTRNGKMNAQSMVRTSIDMVKEKLLTREEAIARIGASELEQLFHRRIDPKAKVTSIAKGIAASPGAASGVAVFDADTADKQWKESKTKVILVREETKPDDVHGFFAAQGILTSRGGKTSHAAVVARGLGKPCVVGAESIKIDYSRRTFTVGSITVKEGDVITIDGSMGTVMQGEVPTIEPDLSPELKQLLQWADEIRTLGVRANADEPVNAKRARDFGAEGIGLDRTERMFNAPDRLTIMHKMILAETVEERKKYLDQLMPMQKKDFKEILKVMEGLEVTIRLLDPPLHEFLPSLEQLLEEKFKLKSEHADQAKVAENDRMLRRVRQLTEVNPMMGQRGVRVGIMMPEIYEMQTRAIIEAATELIKEGVDAKPEIMLPNVGSAEEMKYVRERVERIVKEVIERAGVNLKYHIGTMMEVVRSCLVADKIAQYAEFFSFGTNDLTQGTFSFSREDAEAKFVPKYLDEKLLPFSPFETIDRDGVGKLMAMAVESGRKTRPDLKVGICGEHGGDPNSIEWCHLIDLNYVSCSPFRVPIARLAAAQAEIRFPRGKTEKPKKT